MECLEYFKSRDISLTFTSNIKTSVHHNVLSYSLSNPHCSSKIIKELLQNKELKDHVIVHVNGTLDNVLTYYLNNNINIKLSVITVLLEAGCAVVFGNKFNNYKHNALLVYLHNTDKVDKHIIDEFMNLNYLGHVTANVLLYDLDRVYNIITWYVKYSKNPQSDIIEYLINKGVNLNFIDNRSNNISEIYMHHNDIDIKMLIYLNEKKVKMSEYCMVYYLEYHDPTLYQENIVDYLFKIIQVCYHDSWAVVNNGYIKRTLLAHLPNSEFAKSMKVDTYTYEVDKSYFKMLCAIS
jgi:hypothetical protein